MDQSGEQILRLMFKPGETVCVSNNKYGYHSIPLENAFLEKVTLVPPDPKRNPEFVSGDSLIMVALNPIKGFREDANCTAFRSFLIEMDAGPLDQQLAYIKAIRMPYSAVIFSGNKSLHFLITLDIDLPSEDVYRIFSEWILKICTLADQKTKNPSRSIRVPGAYREPGKKQELREFKGIVSTKDLVSWLKEHPEAKPQKPEKRQPTDKVSAYNVRQWVIDRLINGLDPTKGRSNQWYAMAYEFALSGYSEHAIMDILGEYFTPERSFKMREWRTTIKSACKKAAHGK